MSHPYDHAVSSARKFGGVPDDYVEIHSWFDESKSHLADWRHRGLRHHTEGIFMAERIFGVTFTRKSDGKVVRTRPVGEQHVVEDLGWIPTVADWFSLIPLEKWMGHRDHRLSGAKTVEDATKRQESLKALEAIPHVLLDVAPPSKEDAHGEG